MRHALLQVATLDLNCQGRRRTVLSFCLVFRPGSVSHLGSRPRKWGTWMEGTASDPTCLDYNQLLSSSIGFLLGWENFHVSFSWFSNGVWDYIGMVIEFADLVTFGFSVSWTFSWFSKQSLRLQWYDSWVCRSGDHWLLHQLNLASLHLPPFAGIMLEVFSSSTPLIICRTGFRNLGHVLEVTPSLHTNQQFGVLALIWCSKMRAGSSFYIVTFFLLTCFELCKVLNRTRLSLLLTLMQYFDIVFVLAELTESMVPLFSKRSVITLKLQV